MTWREVASFLAARSKKGGFVMSVDQLDAWVRAYLEDVFNGHNLQSLDKYMTENLVSHWLGDRGLQGREAWKEAMARFFDAFPDAAYTLNDLFFAGDKACGGEPDATQHRAVGGSATVQGEVD
jgi:predicted ester cyclase